MPAMKKAQKKKASPARKPKSAAKKSAPQKSTVKKSAAKKSAASGKSSGKGTGGGAMFGRRADYGAPIDGFFAKQPPHLRAVLEALRALVEEAAPEATAALKWGMPFYTLGGSTMCAIAGHKSHVNLILAGPPGTYADPGRRLEGDGKTGRHLSLRSVDELPREAVRGWLRTAVQVARAKG
jgi:hypothetical protein